MNIDYTYKELEWCQYLHNKSDDCFFDSNIIVPDSMDDIAKIITVKSYPYITDSKTDTDRITVNGMVKINILYIGENETGKISSLSYSTPFSHTFPSPGTDHDYISHIGILSASSSCSVVNSRKVKLTSQIKFSADSYKNMRTNVLCSAKGAETKTIESTFASARSICTKSIVINSNTELPPGSPAIVKILKVTPAITDKDFKTLNNKVIVKGNISLNILYLSEDTTTAAAIDIPFTEVTEAEGLTPDQITNINISFSEFDISPDTDLSGEYKMVDASIILTVDISSFKEDSLSVITDIYCPGFELKTNSCPITARNTFLKVCESENIKETLTLTKGMPSISKVIDLSCDITSLSYAEDTCTANAEITILYQSNDTSSPLNTFTAKIPVTHKFFAPSPTSISCNISHASYAITGDNLLEIRLNSEFKALSGNTRNLSIYTSCDMGDPIKKDRASIIVSFVKAEDDLWSIAKKYNITITQLANANAFDPTASPAPGEKLIIPR